jgi:ppGpp synthetase/RelA/SpoT-type nucleotidyltranferase
VLAALIQLIPVASVADRRNKPSHGYRAVHIIAKIAGKPVEIQVRSELQHVWAELSEKLSDVVDPTIKYGGGSDDVQHVLNYVSSHIASLERLERRFEEFQDEHEEGLDDLLLQTTRLKERLAESIRNLTLVLGEKRKRE